MRVQPIEYAFSLIHAVNYYVINCRVYFNIPFVNCKLNITAKAHNAEVLRS